MSAFVTRVHPNDPNITRGGHPYTRPLNPPPPLRDYHERPPQPVYVLGWTFNREDFEELTGITYFGDASRKMRDVWYREWRHSWVSKKCQIDDFLEATKGLLTVYITTNRTREELALAEDRSYIDEAMRIMGKSDDPQWIHLDRF